MSLEPGLEHAFEFVVEDDRVIGTGTHERRFVGAAPSTPRA